MISSNSADPEALAGDSIEVATSGNVSLQHICQRCTRPMLYRSYDRRVCTMFCDNSLCDAWLHELSIVEVPVADPSAP